MSTSRSFLISIPEKDFNVNQLLTQTNGLTETVKERYFLWQNASTPRTTGAAIGYPLPDLLVGTINTLMLLSDDLIKLDNACKSIVLGIERQGKELYQKQYKDATGEKLNNWAHVDSNRSKLDYFMGFQWAEQKYPRGYPLQELSNLIKSKVSKMEDDLKHFQQNYQEKRNLKSAADRMGKGNLLVKDLSNVLQVESKQDHTPGTPVMSTGQPLKSGDFLDTQFMKVSDWMVLGILFGNRGQGHGRSVWVGSIVVGIQCVFLCSPVFSCSFLFVFCVRVALRFD